MVRLRLSSRIPCFRRHPGTLPGAEFDWNTAVSCQQALEGGVQTFPPMKKRDRGGISVRDGRRGLYPVACTGHSRNKSESNPVCFHHVAAGLILTSPSSPAPSIDYLRSLSDPMTSGSTRKFRVVLTASISLPNPVIMSCLLLKE